MIRILLVKFQFHKVRLKDYEVRSAYSGNQFQFHKVRLKAKGGLFLKNGKAVSIP